MERMRELIKLLGDAADAYYNRKQEIMSNREYDALYEELEQLEAQYGSLPESPTQRVGQKVTGSRTKIQHEWPALSLDKTKNVSELEKWLGTKEGILSWKMDGLTIVITYRNGKLELVATRGDGIVGEDITDNAVHFHGLPQKIPFSGKLIIRAEAVISYEEFERINDALPADEDPYKNPRNLASGTVRLLNGIGDRIVDPHVFEMVEMEGGKPRYVEEQFELLRSWGFQVVNFNKISNQHLADAVQTMEADIGHNLFPSDGLVLVYNDSIYGESLGVTGKYPRGAIAFKWEDETYETLLRAVEWSASSTGLLNPVAVYDPVEVEGTTISRASLHNVSYVQNLQIGIGDRITVYKANKIIPQIAENLIKSNTLEISDVCPVCGGMTRIHSRISDGRKVLTLVCTNLKCPAKHLGRFQRFVCRDAMNIVGISDKTIKKFINMGYLHNLADIYRLEGHRDEIEAAEGFGKKSADNLFDAINISKIVEPWRFLYALNIPNVGRDASKKIIRFSGGTFDGFLEKLRLCESFLGADDIGEVTNQSIYAWKENRDYMDDLMDLVDLMQFKQVVETTNALSGKTVVITGTVETFKNRDEFVAFVELNGGKVSGSVSKKTAYLVNNNVFSESSKNKKAKELGISIVSELEFKNIVLGM